MSLPAATSPAGRAIPRRAGGGALSVGGRNVVGILVVARRACARVATGSAGQPRRLSRPAPRGSVAFGEARVRRERNDLRVAPRGQLPGSETLFVAVSCTLTARHTDCNRPRRATGRTQSCHRIRCEHALRL